MINLIVNYLVQQTMLKSNVEIIAHLISFSITSYEKIFVGRDKTCVKIMFIFTLSNFFVLFFLTSSVYCNDSFRSYFLLPELHNTYNYICMDSSKTYNNGLPQNKQASTESYKSLSSSEPSSSQQTSPTTTATNLCIVCSTRSRALAFVPCGHFAVCVPCGHGLKICPTCGLTIKGLMRIYN